MAGDKGLISGDTNGGNVTPTIWDGMQADKIFEKQI